MLDGQPFFPMIVYSICPYQYAAALASGINVFALNACGTFQGQINALGGAAYSTAVAGGNPGSGPGVIGWFQFDEPDGWNMPAASLPGPPPGVPSLSFLTLTDHFYSQSAALPWGRAMYPSLIAKADVIGFDMYPLQERCQPSHLAYVYDAQRELVSLAAQKPTFQWIEANNWKCPDGATAVTPATVRAESWLAIAAGARGLGFFPATFPPAIGGAIAAISRDVAKLGPALLAQPGAASADGVYVGARTYQRTTYVIAVNATFGPVRGTIRVSGLGTRVLHVYDEGRDVLSFGDTFTDDFAPLAVHVYVASPG
jgi:hypothetical protein